MSNAVALESKISEIEKVLVQGDLAPLNSEQRVKYVNKVCETMGLNPMTKPFEFIKLNGKIQLYAKKDATDQLRRIYRVSIDHLETTTMGDLYIVKAHASTPDGRKDIGTGALIIKNLKGEALANALMKAETKAKRRVTLSICGLGLLDEIEAEDAKNARLPDQQFIESADKELDANDFTAELEEKDVTPQEPVEVKQMIKVRINYTETDKRKLLKDGGFSWNAKDKVWETDFQEELVDMLQDDFDFEVVEVES